MKRRKTSINLDDSSESEENYTLDSVDRFSALPDSVLGVILSFLPTKNSVATSLLSKRWKSAWLTICNLDFFNENCTREEPAEGEQAKFVEFVNRVLLLHDSGLLNKFNLVWRPYCILSHASSWVSTAIARNVHELSVHVTACIVPRISDDFFEMPISVFSCGSLRSLELGGDIHFSDANVVCLPRLENLRLVSVVFESEEAFERLITGCLMLKYLYLDIDTDYSDILHYIISSSTLRHLEVSCLPYYPVPHEGNFFYNLELEASSLEYLEVKCFRTGIFMQKNLSSLVEANFDIELIEKNFAQPNFCNLLVEAVRALECAKVITLSGDVMWALSRATISLSTEFKRLVKLKTTSYCCYTSSLRDFIQSSDSLEALTVIQEPNVDGKTYLHDHSSCTVPVEIPRCLSNSLKEVELNGYSGFEDERELVQYMLKHGSVLKVMKIGVYSTMDSTKFELLQEICKFSRKSLACEVEFIDDLPSPIVMTPVSSYATSEEESIDG